MENNFLKENWKRQLVVLVSNDASKDNFIRENIVKLNNGFQVMKIDEFDALNNEITIMDNVRPYDRMVLALSPYDDYQYIELDKVKERLSLEKSNRMINFLRILGAKNIEISEVKIERFNKSRSFSVKGSHNMIMGTAEFKEEKERILKTSLEQKAGPFSGILQYEEAIDYLNKYNLNGDPEFAFFKEYVNPAIKNEPAPFSREISYSNTFTSILDIGVEIMWPGGFLKPSFNETFMYNFDIVSKLSVEF